jgi:diguanylate cyclase (GGDEF)-like protein/PAS domain S-box-containing protein
MENLVVAGTAITGTVLLVIGIYILVESNRGRNWWFAGFVLSAAVHCVGYAHELTADTVEMAFAFIKLEYVGIVLHPFFALFAALEFAGSERRFDKRLIWGMATIAAVTLVAVYTNDMHHLYYAGLELTNVGGLSILRITPGIWYKLHMLYVEICSVAGVWVVARALIKAPADLKAQYRLCLASFLAPVIGNTAYALGWIPYNMDPAPVYMLVTTVLLSYGFYGHQLLSVVPLARRLVVDSMDDVMIVLSRSNRIIDHNPALKWLPLCHSKDCLGQSLSSVFADYPEVIRLAEEHSEGSVEVTLKDGSERVLKVSLRAVNDRWGKFAGRCLIMSDITAQMRLLDSMRRLAHLDSLTNIANRRILNSEMAALEEGKAGSLTMCVLMIDIDDFKVVNDEYGHAVGDMILQEVAAVLKANIRSEDTLVRYGGEEFVVLAPAMELNDAMVLAERLRRNVSEIELMHNGKRVRVTASIGVAGGTAEPGAKAERLLENADVALYEAKRMGKNRVARFRAA